MQRSHLSGLDVAVGLAFVLNRTPYTPHRATRSAFAARNSCSNWGLPAPFVVRRLTLKSRHEQTSGKRWIRCDRELKTDRGYGALRFSETAEISSSETSRISDTDACQFRNRHLCRTNRLVACRSSTGRPETCSLVLRAGCRGLRLSNRRCGWASGDRGISFPTAVTRFRLRR